MFPAHVILGAIDSLPTLPEAVARLSGLVARNDATAHDFEQAVKHDPILTTNLIRAANSGEFSRAEPVSSLRASIERVGMQRLVEVAVGSSFRRSLPTRIPGYGITAQKFWIHCIAVATIAENLAERLQLLSADMAFTCGLLHDIGQLGIGGFFAEMMPESDWWTFDTPEKERTLLGCNHCDIGHGLAVKWDLPVVIRDVCRWHHELPKTPKDVDVDLVTVIHAADALSFMIGFGGVGYYGEVLDELGPVRMGIGEQELLELAKSLRHAIGQNALAIGCRKETVQ